MTPRPYHPAPTPGPARHKPSQGLWGPSYGQQRRPQLPSPCDIILLALACLALPLMVALTVGGLLAHPFS
mgnify:CR=1 FL=1